MKKILLSLLFAGSFAAAKAQTISVLLSDSSLSTQKAPIGSYVGTDGATATKINTTTGNLAGATGYYLHVTGSAVYTTPGTGYYAGFAINASGASYGFASTDLTKSYLVYRVNTNGSSTKVGFSLKTTVAEYYVERDYSTVTAAQTGWLKDSILITDFKSTVSTNSPTLDSVAAFRTVVVKIICTNGGGTCSAEVNLDDVYLNQYAAAVVPPFIIYDGDSPTAKISSLSTFGATGSTVTFPSTGSGATANNHGNYVKAVSTGANPSNYQGGFGGAAYVAGGYPSFGYNRGTANTTTYVKYRFTSNGADSVKIELQFNTAASGGATTYQYGYDVNYNSTETPAALSGWIYDSIPLINFRLIVSNSLTSTPLLSDSIPYLGKLGVSINSIKNGVRTTEVNMDDITFVEGGVTSIFAAAPTSTNVASSSLYPNPATGVAYVKLSLKSSSVVKVSVSDVMGKVMYTSPEVTTNDYNNTISLAGYNKGLYTVSYIVDGGVAKSQLLVVE